MRIRGGRDARPARATAEQCDHGPTARVTRTPAFGIAVITPLIFAAAVGAGGPAGIPEQQRAADVTPLAAVAPAPPIVTGPAVVPVAKPRSGFRVAAASMAAPPPAVVVSSPGALRIPAIALSAYRNAESMMTRAQPDCGVSWNLLAGIGRIESGHANNGATDTRGTAVNPIYGPALDGSLPGNEIIVASSQVGRVTYARAMGPMQFLPGTWSRYASDGDGDGKTDPQNVYDATLAAARYLCSGGMNLRNQSQVMAAILRYNNSAAYARNVLGWAAAYATGVAPVNLPPILGPTPPIADARLDTHLEANPAGLGPDLPGGDPLAEVPTFNLNQTNVANQLPVPPGPTDPSAHAVPLTAPCTIFCIDSGPPAAAPLPPWMQPAPAWTPPWMQPAPVWTPPWMQPAPQVQPEPAGLPGPAPAPAAPAPPIVPPAPGPAPMPAPAPIGPGEGPLPGPIA